MIVSRTPMRISFVGGGTDLSNFYSLYGGAVISMAINKYFYLSMHKSFKGSGCLIKYSKVEKVTNIQEIQHPIIRQVFTDWNIRNVDFSSAADIPSGTGLGSSSAFTCGLVSLCSAFTGKYFSPARIAEEACQVEIEKLGEPIGKQDQYGCAFGGLKMIEFFPDESVVVTQIFLKPSERLKLENNLFLVYMGGSRSASEMLIQQTANINKSEKLVENLKYMANQARELRYAITENVDVLGEYMHNGWLRKKELSSSISNEMIDNIYETARNAGATGGKLLGAGGAGFLLLYVPETKHANFQSALSGYYIQKIKIDQAGSVIVYDDNNH
jgi:D-glycero-alpha-D-manno-heptose-7-phosphate kinase